MTKIAESPLPQEQALLEMTGRRPSTRAVSKRRPTLQGPLRALRLCVLCVLVPGMLISVPLYLRYHVYNKQEYPLSMSDMRLINAHVSTTWCQSQRVRANATFNAYVVDGTPIVVNEPQKVSMGRQLVLEDDMKEYWAFYLLKGSSVTVSTCVRWQGASLIIIKGHKHLRECAYIGDDSSEEDDEMQEDDDHHTPGSSAGQNLTSYDVDSNRTNIPMLMRRARPGVSLNNHQQPFGSQEQLKRDYSESSEEEDSVLARMLLRKATDHAKAKSKSNNVYNKPIKTEADTKAATAKEESQTLSPSRSSEVFDDILSKLQLLGPKGRSILKKLNDQIGQDGDKVLQEKLNRILEGSKDATGENVAQLKGAQEQTSQTSVDLGGTVEPMNAQNVTQKEEANGRNSSQGTDTDDGASKNQSSRKRRQLSFGSADMHDMFNKNDGEGDAAIEEDLEPDGIADHHRTLNQTSPNDKSNSEFWSSFSSSEEALLKCAGLVLNLPLTPHRRCERRRSAADHATASLPNTITYKVSSTGYYFFVFSSENEIQPNYFRVHFQLEKTMYNVSNAIAECKNATDSCALPLTFWSSDTVVLELPVGTNDSAWNEDFVVVSQCEPRTAVYLVCVISVPLVILLFALH